MNLKHQAASHALAYVQSGIADPQTLARALAERPGIVEHGLFLGVATEVIVAGASGMRVMQRHAEKSLGVSA